MFSASLEASNSSRFVFTPVYRLFCNRGSFSGLSARSCVLIDQARAHRKLSPTYRHSNGPELSRSVPTFNIDLCFSPTSLLHRAPASRKRTKLENERRPPHASAAPGSPSSAGRENRSKPPRRHSPPLPPRNHREPSGLVTAATTSAASSAINRDESGRSGNHGPGNDGGRAETRKRPAAALFPSHMTQRPGAGRGAREAPYGSASGSGGATKRPTSRGPGGRAGSGSSGVGGKVGGAKKGGSGARAGSSVAGMGVLISSRRWMIRGEVATKRSDVVVAEVGLGTVRKAPRVRIDVTGCNMRYQFLVCRHQVECTLYVGRMVLL